jgi:hypothetical protein
MKYIINFALFTIFVFPFTKCYAQDKYDSLIEDYLIKNCDCSFEVDENINEKNVIGKIEKLTFGDNSKNVDNYLNKIKVGDKSELEKIFSGKDKDFGFFDDDRSDVFISKRKKGQIICLLTLKMHLYYINEKSENVTYTKIQENFYKEIKDKSKGENEIISIKDPTKKKDPLIIPVVKSSNHYFIISIFLSIITLALLCYIIWSKKMIKAKHTHKMQDEQLVNNEKKYLDEIEVLKSQIKRKDVEISSLEEELKKYKSEIVTLKNPLIHNNTILENKVNEFVEVKKEVKYLQEPNDSGVFYKNSIREAKNFNSLYFIEIESSNPNRAKIFLIKDNAVISRAESMPQQLLMPVCEINSRGDININSLKIEPGIVVKENDSWKVTKKIVLTW